MEKKKKNIENFQTEGVFLGRFGAALGQVLGSPHRATELRRHVRQVIVGQVQSTEPSRLQDALWEDGELVALLGTIKPSGNFLLQFAIENDPVEIYRNSGFTHKNG